MTIVSTSGAPYFDPAALRRELMALSAAHEGAAAQHTAVIDCLKAILRAGQAAARQELESQGGRCCAEGLSRFQDELIRLIYDHTLTNLDGAELPAAVDRMVIIATGGYGRGLLAPGSDIDLLFLLPS